jgi:hypothetical protein
MTPTTYQKPEIRDSNDNIIQQGAFGKNTALSNATNDGWIDYVANDLEALNNNKADANAYLPLTGGTMTGAIKRAGVVIQNTRDNSWVGIAGGSDADKGAFLRLNGIDNAGSFSIVAKGENTNKVFLGYPDGALTWDGKLLSAPSGRILTASGTVEAVQNSYVNITSVVLDKSKSDKWFVFAHIRISADVNNIIAARLGGLSSSTIRFNGSASGGAVNGIVVNITSNTTYSLSAYTSASAQFNYIGTMWAIPLM